MSFPNGSALPCPVFWFRHDLFGRGRNDRGGPTAVPACASDPVLIGYLRGRTDDEGALTAQRQVLADAGCEQLVEDVTPGEQLELRRMLDGLRPGDVLIVSQLDGLGRSVAEVVRRVGRIAAAGADLRSLKEGIDTATDAGRAVIGSLTALDRSAVSDGITARVAAARAQGRRSGRPPKLTDQQRLLVGDEVLSGRSTASRMARFYKVSEATISRVVAAYRTEAAMAAGDRTGMAESVGKGDKIAGILPLAALDDRLAIVGTSGSGKTYAAKGLAERLMAGGGRVCIVDPLGVWWGLRSAADGHAPSPFPVVVFGGPHADVALDPGMGTALGTLIGTRALACVVDVSDLGSAAVRRTFMTAFTAALYEANTEPLHLVLDEADLWAPQRVPQDGQELLGRVEEIVRRGRIRGFVPWLITQRPAVLHKDVLSQADILVSMKLTSSQDRDAVGRWIEGQADRAEGRRILGALPRLARGEGWVWAPGDGVLARVAFPRIRTLDSSQTPRREAQASVPRALAVVDLSDLRAALAGMAGDAIEEESPAPAAHAQVSNLERRLQQREAELAAARVHLARMEAETATMQARLDGVGRQNG